MPRNFLVAPRVTDKFTVAGPGKAAGHVIERTEGAWDAQDFFEFADVNEATGKRKTLVSVICPHDPVSYKDYSCSIFGPDQMLVTNKTPVGDMVASFPSVVKTIDEARKLVHAILESPSGWKKGKGYKSLVDQLSPGRHSKISNT